MNSIQTLYDPVHWYEGMLLSALHFQQNNLYFERLMSYRAQLNNPYSWGVFHLEIDKASINRGILEVTQLIAILPDGTVARAGTRGMYPNETVLSEQYQEDAGGLSLDLAQLKDIRPNSPFYVYLGLPHLTKACASDHETDMKRYDSIKVASITDQNDIKNQMDIDRLRPKIQLIPANQFGAKSYSGFRLAKLEKDDAGNFKLLPFVPAILVLKEDAHGFAKSLVTMIDETLSLISEKASMICNYFTDRKTDEHSASLQRQRVYHLTAQIPALMAVYKSENVSPFALFQSLLNVAGHMAPLTNSLIPPSFNAYRHDKPIDNFTPVLDYINGVCHSIHFNFSDEQFTFNEDNHTYQSTVQHLNSQGSVYIACKVAENSSIEALTQWMESASIASLDTWDEVIDKRIQGANRTALYALPEMNLTASENEVFYVLSSDSGDIQPNQALFIRGVEKRMEMHRPQRIKLIMDKRGE